MSKKLTYKEVKEYIESFGYKLLTPENEYIDTVHYIMVQCDRGHKPYPVKFNSFKNSKIRCNLCGIENKLTPYEDVKEYVESVGYKLLTTKHEYIANHHHITVQCDRGHKQYPVKFNSFKNSKTRCKQCNMIQYRDVKEYIESFKYKLLTPESEYVNTHTHIIVQCDKKHKPYPVTFSAFKKGTRCSVCWYDKIRMSYKKIKAYIESFKYKLLTPESEYVNTGTSIIVQCDKKHKPYPVTFSAFKNNSRCNQCNMIQYKDVKEYIESFKYKLLTPEIEYVNTHTHIIVQCDKEHNPYPVTFNSFKAGRRCQNCRMIQYEDVKEYVESVGYKLLTPESEYVDQHQRIMVQCDRGHKPYSTLFKNFRYGGRRCNLCDIENKITPYEDVKEYVESVGYKLLTPENEYIDTVHYIMVQCNKGHHAYSVKFSDFKRGKCNLCGIENKITPYKDIKEIVDSVKGYTLITSENEYINAHTHIIVQCDKGHPAYPVIFRSFKKGGRCPYCAKKSSKISQDLFKKLHLQLPNILDVYYYEHQHEYMVNTKRSYRMLDFYIPSLNKCIEFNGTYWHGFPDSEKKDLIREDDIKPVLKGVQFWYVDEQDYRDNPDEVMFDCMQFLNI